VSGAGGSDLSDVPAFRALAECEFLSILCFLYLCFYLGVRCFG
jgi:hypothetical protein